MTAKVVLCVVLITNKFVHLVPCFTSFLLFLASLTLCSWGYKISRRSFWFCDRYTIDLLSVPKKITCINLVFKKFMYKLEFFCCFFFFLFDKRAIYGEKIPCSSFTPKLLLFFIVTGYFFWFRFSPSDIA